MVEESDQENENQQEYIGNTSMKEDMRRDAEEEIVADRKTMEEGMTEEIAVMAESEEQQVELPLECVVKYRAGMGAGSFVYMCIEKKIGLKTKYRNRKCIIVNEKTVNLHTLYIMRNREKSG